MERSRPVLRHTFPWSGTIQGAIQAALAATWMWVGKALSVYVAVAPESLRPAFWLLLLGVAAALVGLGVGVDALRTRTPLSFRGPALARGLVLLAAVGLAWWIAVESRMKGAVFVLAVLGGGAMFFVVVDRILGPAWILGGALWTRWTRRAWTRHEVVELDGARALLVDAAGARTSARSEVPLERGPAYLAIDALVSAPEPYRSDVRANVRGVETLEERAARSRCIGIASLALLSGLAWLALPWLASWGIALARSS